MKSEARLLTSLTGWCLCACLIATSTFSTITSPAFAADKTAVAQAKKKGWQVDWLEGTTLSSKTVVIKRFGRLQRNELWENIELLYTQVLGLDDRFPQFKNDAKVQKDFRDMEAYAYFYRARHTGLKVLLDQNLSPAESAERMADALKDLQEAVKLGYRNPDEIKTAKELFRLWEDAEYKKLVADLSAEAQAKLEENYRNRVDEGIARLAKAERQSWAKGADLRCLDDSPFWSTDKPMVVVISRVHHDGFDKSVERIRVLRDGLADRARVGVAFYQFDASDKSRIAQTAKYAERLGVDLPVTIIDREGYTTLRAVLSSRHDEAVKLDLEKTLPLVKAGLSADLDPKDAALLANAFDDALDHARKGEATAAAALPAKVAEKRGKNLPKGAKQKAAWTKASKKLTQSCNRIVTLLSYDIFQPVIVFFDAEGVPVYQTNGVLADWQIAYVMNKYAGLAGQPAPKAGTPTTPPEKATPDAPTPGN